MPARVIKPKSVKEILARLERMEKKLDECIRAATHCVDLTAMGTMLLANPFTATFLGHTFTLSTANLHGLPLEIKPNPPSPNSLRIPYDLTITISPPCQTMEFDVASYSILTWDAYDSAGNALPSIPPPPAPHGRASSFTVTGGVAKMVFKSQNEESILKICCH